MLGKLFKYEFKATARILGFIYLAVLVCAALFGLIGRRAVSEMGLVYEVMHDTGVAESSAAQVPDSLRIATGVIGIIYWILIMALFIVTIVMIINRFYRNLLCGEGYLMHALPVPTWMLVVSKTLSALLWVALAAAVTLLSAFIAVACSGLLHAGWAQTLIRSFRELFTALDLSTVLMFIIVLMEMVCFILTVYFCLSVGNMANQHKILFAILTFIGIMIAEVIIASIAQNGLISGLIGTSYLYDVSSSDSSDAIRSMQRTMHVAEIKQIIMNLVYSVLFFLGTTATLRNRLNLE